jgi:hypothetical protein
MQAEPSGDNLTDTNTIHFDAQEAAKVWGLAAEPEA